MKCMKMKTGKWRFLRALLLLCSMVVSMSFCISASAAKESEDNGTFARADKIALGTLVKGDISAAGDEDFFKFTISKTGKITIKEYWFRPEGYDGVDGVSLYLYDSNRRAIYEQKDDEFTAQSISVTPGTYYIRVTQCGTYGDPIPYGFKITFSKGKGTYRNVDNFNSFSRAKKISLGKKVYGNISKSDECDYYKFTLPQAGVVDLTKASAQSGDDYELWNTYLYNSRKEIIDAGMNSYGGNRVGLAAGTYYIKVTRGNRWNKKNYYIMVRYKKSNSWEKELNDTLDCSTTIRLNSYMYGSSNVWSDVDCYTFTVPRDGKVKFEFYMGMASYITLYDSEYRQVKGKLLCEMYGGGDEDSVEKATKTVSLKKGRYYLKINHDYLNSGSGNSNYRFRICMAAQPASIKLNRTSVTLSLPSTKTAQLKATVTGTSKKVTWKSSNTRVATVSSTGKVTAKAAGKTVITASANGKTAKCTVTVKNIKVSKAKAEYLRYLQRSEKVKVKFAIRDIFGDSTPELITIKKYLNSNYRSIMIQWYDPSFQGYDEYAGSHHLRTLELLAPDAIYVNKKKKIYVEYQKGTPSGYAVRRLPTGDLLKSFWAYSDGEKMHYRSSETFSELTQKQWSNQIGAYLQGCVYYSEKTLSMYTNNSSNRNRILK